jgi:arabinan endo-1,5-alpha-L-arabinosidase
VVAVLALAGGAAGHDRERGKSYRNPLPVKIPGDGRVESCADPTVIRGRGAHAGWWYAYCTTDPLNDEDRTESGEFRFRLIPILRSRDLVNWTYVGEAFTERPAWVGDTSGMWAPDIAYINGRYHLYFTAPETDLPGGGSAIGVGISANPAGPFVDSGGPVVEPHAAPCCPGSRRWVFDPDVIEADGVRYIFYGSYFGGISARRLSPDGLHSDPASQVQITIANRYEGGHVVKRGGFYYLFASATDCCRGPLTGYSVFAGRSTNVLGPYVDREGASLLAGRVGGTPVLSMNGNRWVGPGHNTVFRDDRGQTWTLYHAIDRDEPYFEGAVGFTKRPMLLDRVDWIDGWPTVRGGLWASDTRQPAPAVDGHRAPKQRVKTFREPRLGPVEPQYSDEFDGTELERRWTWVRPPAPGTYGVAGGVFRFETQSGDLHVDSNSASVLTRPAPRWDYAVETKMRLSVPPEGCCFNFVQGGVLAYGDDDNYLKLTHVSIFETRQTEFAKELAPVPPGYPRYGNTVVGAPGEWTYLRITRERERGDQHYTAYTSVDGSHWVHGGTWTHDLEDVRLALVSMGGSGFVSEFDYVRTYRLKGR